MLRKVFCALGVGLLFTVMASCRPSEDNQEYEPKIVKLEQLTDKMADGTATLSEMTEAMTLIQEIAEVEEKEGKVLSSSQVDRIEKVAEKLQGN